MPIDDVIDYKIDVPYIEDITELTTVEIPPDSGFLKMCEPLELECEFTHRVPRWMIYIFREELKEIRTIGKQYKNIQQPYTVIVFDTEFESFAKAEKFFSRKLRKACRIVEK